MALRVPSLEYSFNRARWALSERFRRLPRFEVPNRPFDDEVLPADLDVLALLRDTSPVVRTDQDVQAEYERLAALAGSQLPSFNEAIARGWIRKTWRGLANSPALGDYFAFHQTPFSDELREFRKWLWQQPTVVANQGTHNSANPFEKEFLDLESSKTVPSLSPEWVAARLWDEAAPRELMSWELGWRRLGRPDIVPSLAWREDAAEEFRKAVLDTAASANLPTWKEESALDGLLQEGDLRKGAEAEPEPTLLGRYLQRASRRALVDTEELDCLLGILVRELAVRQVQEVPSVTAKTLLDLAVQFPSVFDVVTQFVVRAPDALADFILDSRATGLVCYIVAEWDKRVQVERENRDATGLEVHRATFEDCLEVLGHFAKNNLVGASEYSQLLVALQTLDASRDERSRAELLPSLIEQLAGFAPSFTALVVADIAAHAAQQGSDSASFAVLLHVLARTGTSLSAQDATYVAQAYVQALSADTQPTLSLIDEQGAGAFLAALLQHGDALAAPLLNAVDVKARLESGASELGTALAVRSHLRFLSKAVAGFPGAVPDALVRALAALVETGARDQRVDWQVDAFSPDLEVFRRPQRRLELDVAQALARLENPAHQTQIVDALLKVKEPITLAIFLRRAPRTHQERFKKRLENLPPEDAAPAYTTQQLQRRVTALLEAGLPDVAEKYREQQQKRLALRPGSISPLQALVTDLHLKYLRQDWSGIMAAQLPTGLKDTEKAEANHSLDFFKGLALLSKDDTDPVRASALFDRLHAKEPSTAVAVNLLAANLARLLPGNPFAMLSGAQAKEAVEVLARVDATLPLGRLSEQDGAIHYPNRAALLLALGRHAEALKSLAMVTSVGRSPESAAYEAVAESRHGDFGRASHLLRTAETQFGTTPILKAAGDYIAGATPQAAPVRVLTREGTLENVSSAFGVFAGLPADEQAAIVSPGPGALERVLIDAMSDALSAFTRLIPFLKLNYEEYHEDHLNTLVASLMQAHLSFKFGWQAHDQTFGGLTGAGNHGERDFVVKKGGDELAVYEALRPANATDKRILQHFEKLLAYSTTRLFFHITFSYIPDPNVMMNALEEVAKKPPNGFSFRGQEAIAPQGSRPPGRRAVYLRNGEPITVVFFLVDMGQKVQRQAVKAAPLQNPAPPTPVPTGAPTPTVTPSPKS